MDGTLQPAQFHLCLKLRGTRRDEEPRTANDRDTHYHHAVGLYQIESLLLYLLMEIPTSRHHPEISANTVTSQTPFGVSYGQAYTISHTYTAK